MKNKKSSPKQLHNVFSNMVYVLKEAYEYKPIILFFIFAEIICSSIIPIGGIYLPKIAIELVQNNAELLEIIMKLGAFTVTLLIVYLIYNCCSHGKYMYQNNLRSIIDKKIFMKSITCDYNIMESSQGQTRKFKAIQCLESGDWCGTSKMFTSISSLSINLICFVAYSTVISFLNPLILCMLLGMSAINWFVVKYCREYKLKQQEKFAVAEKKYWYLDSMTQNNSFAKDIRIYSMADFITKVRQKIMNDEYVIRIKIKNHGYIANIVNACTLLLRDGIAYTYLIISVSNGSISVADFVLYFGAIAGFSSFISTIFQDIGEMSGASYLINGLRDYFEQTDSPSPENPKHLPNNMPSYTIEFKNACFSYDENSKVLNDFNLKIESGEKIALVGVNGVGKTTLVKLLCGFYKLNSGEILVNGINLNDIPRDEIFDIYSIIFQDITILPMTVAENVSMRDIAETNLDKVTEVLKKADLYEDIISHENGIKTHMTRFIDENGLTLSGGQQQKLLMARALYKNAPIMIFDEPTAALDPIAEDATYQQFHRIIGDKTAIYVSHRLASTRFCDKIVLIKDGKVCEMGTHSQLMSKNGEYKNMFNIQSEYYNQSAKEETEIC
ncbi:MAG: ABC transporter ATP-binding protein [Oscillospiraceae bacterium]